VVSEHRRVILDVLQGADSPIDAAAVVGFGLVIELLLPDGQRGTVKVTSDAAGRPQPWYMAEGYAAVLRDIAEFDEGEQ
jgi:hypothetical protein